MKFLPFVFLIIVVGIGITLGNRLLNPPPAGENFSSSILTLAGSFASEADRAEAREQARLLSINAGMEATQKMDHKPKSLSHFPALEEVVQEQVENGLLSSSLGESLLTENANRDPSIRLRVGYIYQPKHGLPFPVITNNEIDQNIHNAYNPAESTLRALGLSAKDFPGSDDVPSLPPAKKPPVSPKRSP